jgi:peptide/nickel transport system permease protein
VDADPRGGVRNRREDQQSGENVLVKNVGLTIVRSEILRVVLRRLFQSIPVLLGVSFIVFLVLNILPGGTAVALLGVNATPKLVHALDVRLGLDRPFFDRYFHWLWQALHGNLGDSLENNLPVARTLGERLQPSLEIGLAAFFEALIFAIPTAIAVAKRPHGVLDRLNVAVSMFGFSCPTFLLGLLGIIVFAVNLHWLPATGYVPISAGLGPNIKSIVLPSATVAFGLFCGYTRILRADLVDQMRGEDYIMTARAKGLSQWRILIRHAFRNALFNMITVVVLNIGTLVGGQVLVEQIFAIPGMGLLLISSINNRDIVTVQAEVTLIACAIVAANLLADVLYMVLDPRIRHGRIAS